MVWPNCPLLSVSILTPVPLKRVLSFSSFLNSFLPQFPVFLRFQRTTEKQLLSYLSFNSRKHFLITFLILQLLDMSQFSQTKSKVESGPLLDVVSENETLLRRDAFFVLDLGLNIVDVVGEFNLEGDRMETRNEEMVQKMHSAI